MKTQYTPNRLFAEPSFVEGVGSVLDLGATLHKEYNSSETEYEADRKAIQNDWRAVGGDIVFSILNHEQKPVGSTKQ